MSNQAKHQPPSPAQVGTPRGSALASGTIAKPSVVDVLIQCSVVALFHGFEIAVAPQTPVSVRFTDLAPHYPLGLVAFDSRYMGGTLALWLPEAVLAKVHEHEGSSNDRDLLRGLVSQLMARFKHRLLGYQVTLRSSVPTCIDHESELLRLAPSSDTSTVYCFRTLREQILVVVNGTVDEARLRYSGAG